jgi:SIR2-like domain
MKKKLLVILGAGSSISCNMPSVACLDTKMKNWSQAWATDHGWKLRIGAPTWLGCAPVQDYFAALWQDIETYYRSGKHQLRPPLNFEKVLGEMIALSHWMTPPPWGDTLRQTACDGAPPPHFTFPSPMGYGPAVAVRDQFSHLSIELAKHMRMLSRTIDPADSSVRKYMALFDGLRSGFDVGVYNLNYDSVALTAWPDAYVGFDANGTFDAGAVHARSEWGFLYHLHGSVHHSLVSQFSERIEWRPDLAGQFFDRHQGLSTDDRSEGKFFPKTTLVAGGFKLDQLLVEPFCSFQAALVRHVYEADAILIGGYGFADEHVNRALRNRLAGRTVEDRPPVMILDYADDRTHPTGSRDDLWAHIAWRTLTGHASPPKIAAKGSFKVASPHRVALWYGGFVEAESRLDGIVPWLLGADDATC